MSTNKERVRSLIDELVNEAQLVDFVSSHELDDYYNRLDDLKNEILSEILSFVKEEGYEQEIVPSYIKTYTGKNFYVTHPKAEDVDIEDIAHALSRQSRYTGHTRLRFLSIAEHACLCAFIARILGFSLRIQFIALNHDDSEAYCGDLNRPLKQHVTQYKEIEGKISDSIWDYLDIHPTKEEYEIVKKIDNTALLLEMKQLMFIPNEELPSLEAWDLFEIDITDSTDSMDSWKSVFLEIFNHLKDELNAEQSAK